MREYIKDPDYNDWKNGLLEGMRKNVLIVSCPYCGKATAATCSTGLIDLEKRFFTECEECRKNFYVTLQAKIETCTY